MAEAPAGPPEAERGRGRGRGRRGRGRRGRGRRQNRGEDWTPVTRLGRLVQNGTVKSLEDIYLFSLCIKEAQIVDQLIPADSLKDEVMGLMSVQKQTTAGQRTRFKAYVACGDENGHVGLGWKTAAEVADAIKGATIAAKMSLIPVRRGYWGAKLGNPHTICSKLTGKCGSVRMKLIPAPRGTGIVGAPAPKRLLQFAGIDDCFSSSTGHTRTKGNFLKSTFVALKKSYGFLSPDLWGSHDYMTHPYDMKDIENDDDKKVVM